MSKQNILRSLLVANRKLPDPGDAGTITVQHDLQTCVLSATTTETRTLAVPTQEGLTVAFGMKADTGSVALTVTGGFNATGDTVLTFSEAKDFAVFRSFKSGTSWVWQLVSEQGLTGGVNKLTRLTFFPTPQTIDMEDATETLSLDTSATQITSNILYIDPTSAGASENLVLPAEALCSGLVLLIANTGGEGIVVQDDTPATVITIATTEVGIVWCDGTTWRGGIMATT